MFCKRPSSRLIHVSPKWHALVVEVVTDMVDGEVDEVVVEVGIDDVEVVATASQANMPCQPTPTTCPSKTVGGERLCFVNKR